MSQEYSVSTSIIVNKPPWFRAAKFSSFLLLLVLIGCAHAQPDYTLQREVFRVTDAALAQGQRTGLNAAKVTLRDYPLYPYLIYRDIHQRLNQFPATEVRDFIRTYPDVPLSGVLRTQWLHHLAQSQRWDDFLRDFQPTTQVPLECLRRQALLAKNRVSEALEDIESLWVHGHSRPDACDPVFAVWRQQGGVTQERIWQRFKLAIAAGQDGLARHLYNLLRDERRAIAERWLDIHANPQRVRTLEANQPYAAEMALHGLQRLVRQDSVATAPLFDQLQRRHGRHADPGWNELQRQLALFIAARGDSSAAQRLAAIPPAWVDDDVEAWRIRVPLREQNWPEVLRQIEQLRPETADNLAWRYWRARALEATGNQARAHALYSDLAQQRDYYGFLAADRIQRPYAITHRPSDIPVNVLSAASSEAALLRIRELRLLQREAEAQREWRRLLQQGDTYALQTAALWAHRWGWYNQAIIALVRANAWDDLELRFPLPYREQVITAGRARGIDPAWIYAVMRQESLFQADARSSANALGLMQILPSTGQRIAGELGESWNGADSLLEPAISIRYGAQYLSGNLRRLQNNPVLASAAYNAGSGRVLSWLPQTEPVDADIWAETIPFFETRSYIRRVMEYYVVYGWRLNNGQQPSLQALMQPVRPRPRA